jgi:hypothetical protein
MTSQFGNFDCEKVDQDEFFTITIYGTFLLTRLSQIRPNITYTKNHLWDSIADGIPIMLFFQQTSLPYFHINMSLAQI